MSFFFFVFPSTIFPVKLSHKNSKFQHKPEAMTTVFFIVFSTHPSPSQEALSVAYIQPCENCLSNLYAFSSTFLSTTSHLVIEILVFTFNFQYTSKFPYKGKSFIRIDPFVLGVRNFDSRRSTRATFHHKRPSTLRG